MILERVWGGKMDWLMNWVIWNLDEIYWIVALGL